MFRLSDRSRNNLHGVHPDLVRVVERAIEITEIDFTVTEGRRSKARQEALIKQGKSRTMNSRHLTGHAVDVMALVDGKGSWEWSYYERIATAFKRAADELGVAITWGGEWQTFRDGPHFQLSWQAYPLTGQPPVGPKSSKTIKAANLGGIAATVGAASSAAPYVADAVSTGGQAAAGLPAWAVVTIALSVLATLTTLGVLWFIHRERQRKFEEYGL